MDNTRVKLLIENIEFLMGKLKEEILEENLESNLDYTIDDYDEVFEG